MSFDSDGAMSIAERQRGRERESHKAAMQKGRIEVVLTEMKGVLTHQTHTFLYSTKY